MVNEASEALVFAVVWLQCSSRFNLYTIHRALLVHSENTLHRTVIFIFYFFAPEVHKGNLFGDFSLT